jgi:hypothetical protein
MSRDPRWSARQAVAVGLVLALVGTACSSSRIAGWYLTRRIDSFLDLSSDQKRWVRARVDHHIEELRSELTTEVLPLLRRVRATVARGPTEGELARFQLEMEALFDRFVDRVVSDTAIVLASLEPHQIARFHKKMRQGIDESYEDVRVPKADRRKKADDKLIESLEKWTGSLQGWQVARVLGVVHDLPDTRPAVYRAQVQRLHRFTAFLRKHPGREAIARELQRLWDTRYEAMAPGSTQEAQQADQRRVLLTVDRVLTPKQREKVLDSIDTQISRLKRFAL